MNRRSRTLVVVTVAVVAASLASAGVYRAVQRMPVREVEVAHQFVVMAAHPLPLGTRLSAADVKRVGWPSSSPLEGSFARVEDVAGRGLISPVAENEPITEFKLAPREAGAGLAPAIPEGMRAISVKVNEVIGVAGFAVPGARVDVLVTIRRFDDAVSRILVANVPVLTAGTRYDQEKSRDAKPIPSTVVTLMVTPAQAEKVALASNEGQITLMLRNPLDLAEPTPGGAELSRMVNGIDGTSRLDAIASRPAAAPAPKIFTATPVETVATTGRTESARPGYVVEAIRAGKRTQETIP